MHSSCKLHWILYTNIQQKCQCDLFGTVDANSRSNLFTIKTGFAHVLQIISVGHFKMSFRAVTVQLLFHKNVD